MGWAILGLILGFWTALQADQARAEGSAPAPAPTPTEGAAKAPSRPKKNAPKGRRVREKETEGSQAPNRFEADTVIKSKYQLNGQPLEVDPD